MTDEKILREAANIWNTYLKNLIEQSSEDNGMSKEGRGIGDDVNK